MRRPLAALFAGAMLFGAPCAMHAQVSSPIEFLGFRPGSSRADAEAHLATVGGSWRCTASRDPRITDCRGAMPSAAGTLDLTASLVDGQLAILLLSGPVGRETLGVWRDGLETVYGSVTPRTDHGQETWQWIRRRQMLRLTTRLEAGMRVVSVSLTDGPLLDGLNPPVIRPP
jgi:hypothetical protein